MSKKEKDFNFYYSVVVSCVEKTLNNYKKNNDLVVVLDDYAENYHRTRIMYSLLDSKDPEQLEKYNNSLFKISILEDILLTHLY